jgi:glucokinase
MSQVYIGAIDIGGTKIAVGVVDDAGRILARTETPTQLAGAYPEALSRIIDMVRAMEDEAGVPISGIGIGSTGPVDPIEGKFGNLDTIPQWSGASPVEDLTCAFALPVAIENDADAGALAEASWGAGKDKTRLIYVTIGTGIGGGIIFDGQLYRGAGGAHPEVAHMVIDLSGPPCSCGLRGCWEALASGPALAKWVETQAEYSGKPGLTGKEVYELAALHDALAERAVARETYLIGIGLANLINLFTPDAIVLGGSVMKGAGRKLDGIRQVIRLGCRFVPLESVEIKLASLGDDTNLIGAARTWHHRFRNQRSQGA